MTTRKVASASLLILNKIFYYIILCNAHEKVYIKEALEVEVPYEYNISLVLLKAPTRHLYWCSVSNKNCLGTTYNVQGINITYTNIIYIYK